MRLFPFVYFYIIYKSIYAVQAWLNSFKQLNNSEITASPLLSRWEMPQTHLLCLSPPSPRSMISSWVHSTVFSVSPHTDSVFAVLILLRYKSSQIHNPHPCSFPGLLSLLGNCILLLVAYQKRSSLKPAEFFIINLSISDLGMTVSLFPLAIPSSFSHRYFACPSYLLI